MTHREFEDRRVDFVPDRDCFAVRYCSGRERSRGPLDCFRFCNRLRLHRPGPDRDPRTGLGQQERGLRLFEPSKGPERR